MELPISLLIPIPVIVVSGAAALAIHAISHRRSRRWSAFEMAVIESLRGRRRGLNLLEMQAELVKQGLPKPTAGKIYVTAERLRIESVVDTELRDGTDSRGLARQMRYYWLTEDGLRQSIEQLQRKPQIGGVGFKPASQEKRRDVA